MVVVGGALAPQVGLRRASAISLGEHLCTVSFMSATSMVDSPKQSKPPFNGTASNSRVPHPHQVFVPRRPLRATKPLVPRRVGRIQRKQSSRGRPCNLSFRVERIEARASWSSKGRGNAEGAATAGKEVERLSAAVWCAICVPTYEGLGFHMDYEDILRMRFENILVVQVSLCML